MHILILICTHTGIVNRRDFIGVAHKGHKGVCPPLKSNEAELYCQNVSPSFEEIIIGNSFPYFFNKASCFNVTIDWTPLVAHLLRQLAVISCTFIA
jgi:hypothetical protein